VIVSRGELIEIGDSFRIPEVLERSGARLVEVGTTNRTRAADYEAAIGPDTALLLRVHQSNFRVVGFTEQPTTKELSAVAKRHALPLVDDLGSGVLVHMSGEPSVADSLAAGADLVCFSGDKLFGGPQAGIVAGSSKLVGHLRRHPLLRALRPDKMQLAALGATALAYLHGRAGDLPVWQMIDAAPDDVRRRASKLARRLVALGYDARTADASSVTGGGSLPGEDIPTTTVRLIHPTLAPKDLATRLRCADPAVIVRIEGRAVVVDLRTVLPKQEARIVGAFASLA
jgi:L-seryl-tRNA(Ser) seleniumtransferase